MNKSTKMHNRGSEWNKWDLHIHSPYTFLENHYGLNGKNDDDVIKSFKEQIKTEKIAVVGLTNYFKFDDRDFKLKKQLENEGVAVFLNLEVRLSNTDPKDNVPDYHIIFDNSLTEEAITTFISNLSAIVKGGAKKAPSLFNKEDFETATVDIDNIMAAAKSIEGRCLFGFLSRGHGNATKLRSESISDNIALSSDFVIHSTDGAEILEQDSIFWREYKYPKPVLQSSDAHKIEEIGSKYTWIKATPSFDGFRQVLCSIDERISYNLNNPIEEKGDGSVIKKLQYNGGEILFNNDLNSLIGPRGSGKSIILRNIALVTDESGYMARIGDEQRASRDKEYFVQNFPESKVIWGDGAVNGGAEDNPKRILFVPQGYLSNLVYDENNRKKERDEFLISLFRENESFLNAERQANLFISKNSQEIAKLVDLTFILMDEVQIKEARNRSIGSPQTLKKESEDLSVKIQELNARAKITNDENEKFTNAKSTSELLRNRLNVISQDINILQAARNKGGIIEYSNIELGNLSEDIKIDLIDKIAKASHESTEKIIREKIFNLNEEREKIEVNIKETQNIIEKLERKFKSQQELVKLSERKRIIDNNSTEFEENLKIISENKGTVKTNIEELVEKFFNFKTTQQEIYKTVSIENFRFIDVSICVEEEYGLKENFLTRNINLKKLQEVSSASKNFFNPSEECPLLKENLGNILTDMFNNKIKLKSGAIGMKQAIKELLDNPYKVNFLDSIKTSDGTLFRDMTGGQKAMAILELIFKFDTNNYPILLDQPEDDLDTKGIATDIVSFIKDQKQRRQIFIASHNGSLVVCADSEEIIVARRDDDNFSYETGAIEEELMRKSIIDILEGGEEALNLRMRKLNKVR